MWFATSIDLAKPTAQMGRNERAVAAERECHVNINVHNKSEYRPLRY